MINLIEKSLNSEIFKDDTSVQSSGKHVAGSIRLYTVAHTRIQDIQQIYTHTYTFLPTIPSPFIVFLLAGIKRPLEFLFVSNAANHGCVLHTYSRLEIPTHFIRTITAIVRIILRRY